MIYELDELECMTILRRTCEMIDLVGKRHQRISLASEYEKCEVLRD